MIGFVWIPAWLLMGSGCGIQYMDKPSLHQSDRWVKSGNSKKDIEKALADCGYDEPKWDIGQQENVDICMLSRGYIFIDSPYGSINSRCKHVPYQHLPSCQSLKIPIQQAK